MSTTGESVALTENVRVHVSRYSGVAKSAFVQLVAAWAELEEPDAGQQARLEAITASADGVWALAVAEAAHEQQQVRDDIKALLVEVAATRDALGGSSDELAPKLQGDRDAHPTLRAWQRDVCAVADWWRDQRRIRLAQHDELQGCVAAQRRVCGLAAQPADVEPDLRPSGLEFLRLELTRLDAERDRREKLLRGMLAELAAVCAVIGEDATAAVAAVSPGLVALLGCGSGCICLPVRALVYCCLLPSYASSLTHPSIHTVCGARPVLCAAAAAAAVIAGTKMLHPNCSR